LHKLAIYMVLFLMRRADYVCTGLLKSCAQLIKFIQLINKTRDVCNTCVIYVTYVTHVLYT